MKKGLLLRVALDKGSGGTLAPIFEDGSFEYVPIPETNPSSIPFKYNNTLGRCRNLLSEYVPYKYQNSQIHFDPEFENYTYGEPARPKLNQLNNLNRGDLLIFYAGLKPYQSKDYSRIYIIGYFEVERVEYFQDLRVDQYTLLIKKFGSNAHFFRNQPDKELTVVIGSRKKSKLLEKALPLGDAGRSSIALLNKSYHSYTLPDLCSIGYEKSLQRAVGHKIKGNGLRALEDYIKDGVSSLVDDKSTLRYYSMTADTGFAPNPFGSFLTLACCKPWIRRHSKVGDWIIGTHSTRSTRVKKNSLCFFARVSEILTFKNYFEDERFQLKKVDTDSTGDNIYDWQDNEFMQIPNKNHGLQQKNNDTQVDAVLICSLFWYFGEKGFSSELTDRMLTFGSKGRFGTIPRTGILPSCEDTKKIKLLVDYISSNFRMGMLSNPAGYSS